MLRSRDIFLNYATGIYAFLISVAYWPQFNIYGRWSWDNNADTSLRWALLAVLTSMLLIFTNGSNTHFTLSKLIGILFLTWCCISMLWASNVYDGSEALIHLVILASVFVLGSRLDNLKPIFIGLGLGVNISDLFLSTGLFNNTNVFADFSALVLIGVCSYRLWAFIPGILLAVVVSGSRDAYFACAVIGILCLWNTSNKVESFQVYLVYRLFMFVSIFILLSIIIFSLVSYYHIGSINERLILWSDTIKGIIFDIKYTLFGHGIGSYFTDYQYYSTFDTLKTRPKFAHNDFLQIAFETGLVGFSLGILFIINCKNYIIAAFCILACFSFPFYIPTTAFVMAIVLGYSTRFEPILRITFDNWRVLLFGRYAKS